MTGPAPRPVVQVVGRARTADRVTGTARTLARALGGDVSSRVVACRRDAGCDAIGAVDEVTPDDVMVLHAVDGGEDLAPVLHQVHARTPAQAPVIVVHHGSGPGSDRGVLRALRGRASLALGAEPQARDELHALGFGTVGHLDAALLDDAFDDVVADPATVDNLSQHPGPLLLSVGPVEPGQSIERLLDAFADLVTHQRPSATLSVGGPGPGWYRRSLQRRLRSAGLLACELPGPITDEQLVARLGHATAVVVLHPAGLDPFVQAAARLGVPIVAPRVAATAALPADRLVPLPPRPRPQELASAMAAATGRATTRELPPPVDRRQRRRRLADALGLA